MADEVAQVGKSALECILMYAMYATKNVRAQRDRLVQLRRLLPQRSPGDDGAAGVQEVATGLHKVYSEGLYNGAGYLAVCLETAAENGDRDSFSIYAFAAIPYEQLYGALQAQWHPPRPTTQSQAFARIESAYYAAMLPLDHHLPRCIELLIGVRPPPVSGRPKGGWIGYADNPVAAANEHLAKRLKDGFPEPDPDPAATDKPPQAKTSVDLDLALSYLHRACSLTTLAVKHLDVAVAFISTLLDPDEVGKIYEWTDERVYISELCYDSSNLSPTLSGYFVPQVDVLLEGGTNLTVVGGNSMAQVNSGTACFAFVQAQATTGPAAVIGGFQMQDRLGVLDNAKQQLRNTGYIPAMGFSCTNFNFTKAG